MTPTSRLDADVGVIGLGTMGSMALWRLAERGVSALGFERFQPGHDRGSSGGESRVIRTAYFEGPDYVPFVRAAFELWRVLEHVSGADLLTTTGALMIGRGDSDVIVGTLLSARTHGLAYQELDAGQMAHQYPQHRLRSDDVAVFEHPAGFLRSEACIDAAVKRALALGASIRVETKVGRPERDGDTVTIRAGGETYRFRHVIVAVGPWLGDFLPDLSLPVSVARQVLFWLPVRNVDDFRAERFPVFIRQLGNHVWYGFPTLDGESIKLALHGEGGKAHANSLDRTVTDRDFLPLRAFVARCLPDVEPRPVRSHACMYTNTPDSHFVIGSPPGKPWLTVLGGFSGHGFKFASAVGDAAADLATLGRTDYALDPFSPRRFTPAAL